MVGIKQIKENLKITHIFFLNSADWYKDRLTDAELEELENPKPKEKKPQRVRGPSRRKTTRVVEEEEE